MNRAGEQSSDADFGFSERTRDEYAIAYQIFLPGVSGKAQKRSRFCEVMRILQNLQKDLFKDFIWHRQAFRSDLCEDCPEIRLAGRTEFGDSVADEWAIVYLLKALTMRCEDVWARVEDNDGEFLLIEAANALPKWLEPDVARYRVWLHQDSMLIIPASLTNSDAKSALTDEISIHDAVAFLSTQPNRLMHSPMIEAEAFYRLEKYPKQLSESMHEAEIAVPRKLAYVLHCAPLTISAAVEAFCQSRSGRDKDGTVNRIVPDDLVSMSTKFNRTGYAQLKSQEISPPPTWEPMIEKTKAEGARHLQTGMKLTCGFEALMSDDAYKGRKAYEEVALLLKDIEEGDEPLPTDLEISKWSHRDDDEGWLDVNYEDFEKELSGQAKQSYSHAFNDPNAEDTLRRIVQQFETLMNDDDGSGAENAFLGTDDDDDNELDSGDDEEDQLASFDDPAFQDSMRQMMGMPIDEQSHIHASASRKEETASDNEFSGASSRRDAPQASSKQPSQPTKAQERSKSADRAPPNPSTATSAALNGVPCVEIEGQEPSIEEIQRMMRDLEVELKDEGVLDKDDSDALLNALADDDGDGRGGTQTLARDFLQSLRNGGQPLGTADELRAAVNSRDTAGQDNKGDHTES